MAAIHSLRLSIDSWVLKNKNTCKCKPLSPECFDYGGNGFHWFEKVFLDRENLERYQELAKAQAPKVFLFYLLIIIPSYPFLFLFHILLFCWLMTVRTVPGDFLCRFKSLSL